MYREKKIIAVIPARGGSKGLPYKNVLNLLGKPVISWTIDSARKSKYLDKLIVSTDDQAIAKISRKYGADVPFIRPKKLSNDRAASVDVILHALQYLQKYYENFDYIVLLEPTSPLREFNDIDKAIENLLNNKIGASSLVSVCRVESTHPFFDVLINKKGFIAPYMGKFIGNCRRQDIADLYFFEGTIYISEINELFKRRSFYHGRTIPYIVPRWKSLEIDEILDLICAEAILKNKKKIKGREK